MFDKPFLNISGANQEVDIESEKRYPFEVFLSSSNSSSIITTTSSNEVTTFNCEGGFQLLLTDLPLIWDSASYGDIIMEKQHLLLLGIGILLLKYGFNLL